MDATTAPAGFPVWASDDAGAVRPGMPGALEVDVLVIGGGLRGLTCAAVLAEGGARVALVEAGRIARGRTASGTGAVTALHGVGVADLVAQHGPEAAGAWVRANTAALALLRRLLGRHLATADALAHADRAADLPALEREMAALRRLGLPACWEDDPGLPWPVHGAIRLAGQGRMTPPAALSALADRLVDAGAAVFEGTRAVAIQREGGRLVVHTDRGPVTAGRVVRAAPPLAGTGTDRRSGSARHAVAVPVGDAHAALPLVRAAGLQARAIRPHAQDGRTWAVLVGDPHPADGRLRFAPGTDVLEDFARRALGAGPVTHRWVAHDLQPIDGPHLVERSRDPDVHVPAPSSGWGVAAGVAAAALVADRLLGTDRPELAALVPQGPRRRPGPQPRPRTIRLDERVVVRR